MLDYQASTFSLSPKYGKVAGGSIVVEIVERTLNANTIRAQIDRVKQDITQRSGWANAELQPFRSTAEQAIRSTYANGTAQGSVDTQPVRIQRR